MKKSYILFLSINFLLLFTINSFAQNYFSDFENYTAGQQLACQDTANWTTFSLSPCDLVEDAYITTNYVYSGTNSFVILFGNDILKLVGNQTSGTWHISFEMMIPSGKTGYFNLLSMFNGANSERAIEVFFAAGGAANVNAGGTNSALFSFAYDTWFPVEIIVNLDSDSGELLVNGTSIVVWQWTLGSEGQGSSLMLAAVDFFGAYPDNEMYVDDFWFGDLPVSVKSEVTNLLTFNLEQNYPNPFNPATAIEYSVQSEGLVTLKVYDILGKVVASLVDEYKSAGQYKVEFNAVNLPSGVYFYQLIAGEFIETKKMVLMK